MYGTLVMIQHKVCKFLIDDPDCIGVVMFTMDFSKAFDSVNHYLLANKLNIPLNPYIVKWWLNFLQDRMQRVIYSNLICYWKQANKVTIQGGLARIYFNIFLNDLEISIGEEIICFKYADDCTIVVPVFKNNDSADGYEIHF